MQAIESRIVREIFVLAHRDPCYDGSKAPAKAGCMTGGWRAE
jgi:hypothetical protein